MYSKILYRNSQFRKSTDKKFLWGTYILFLQFFKNNGTGTGTCFKENYFYLKLFLIIFFKIDSKTLYLDPDLDPNWGKILDPDPNQMYCIWIHNTALNDRKGTVYRC